MPIVLDEIKESGSHVGVWQIAEPLEFFIDHVVLTEQEKEFYNKFQINLRRKHWLSYRFLLKYLLKKDVSVIYDVNGKPFLNDSHKYISVSHSGEYAAVIVHPSIPVGIDIEKITPRIEKVFDKFMNEKEIQEIDPMHRLEYLYVHWCAKEALYKMHGKGNLDFIRDIFIESFPYSDSGIIQSYLITEGQHIPCKLHYEKLDDYMLAYTV